MNQYFKIGKLAATFGLDGEIILTQPWKKNFFQRAGNDFY